MATYNSKYTGEQIDEAVEKAHSHSNTKILVGTTASYTEEEKTKLSEIEAGAEVNTIFSVNGKTGEVVLSASDIGALAKNELKEAIANKVSSDVIKTIQVVDELPEVEEEGVLYLVKEVEKIVPTIENLYPNQTEITQSDGFEITFKDQYVTVNGSNDSASLWAWTNHFKMDLEANKTYYLQFTNTSGSFDDSKRVSDSDGIVTTVSISAFDSSGNENIIVNQVERTADEVYNKYLFTPTDTYAEYSVSLQVKKYNVFDNWTCSIVIAEE